LGTLFVHVTNSGPCKAGIGIYDILVIFVHSQHRLPDT
jgi:hypothetical protein